MRLVRLLTAALILNAPQWGPPGRGKWKPGTPVNCPRCGTTVRCHTSHSAKCPNDNWFLFADCASDCTAFAYSFDRPRWECASSEHDPFSLPLCPKCWHWGVASPQNPAEFTCSGTRTHKFYLNEPMVCPRCRKGLLVFTSEANEAVCEACGKTQPRGDR